MSKLPKLTEDQIRAWTDSRSYSRGSNYFQQDAIINPRRTEMVLRAQCEGSAFQPYRVNATLSRNDIAAAYCSCPIGAGGHCKHVVALLLTWVHQPEQFHEVIALRESLNERSKEELVELVLKLVERIPDLEPLVEMPLPGHGTDKAPVDAALIKRQVQQVIGNMSYEWGASYAAAGEVSRVVAEGDAYANADDWRNAAIVYSTIAQEILGNYEDIYEEEGEFLYEVGRCAKGLTECLEHIDNDEQRHAIIQTLFDIVRWDIDFGGVGVGDEAELALEAQTTPDERVEIAAWARTLLTNYEVKDDSYSSGWRKQALGGFLLNLEMDTLDDEAFIDLCRETGRLRDLVKRLLDLGRVQQAVNDARSASDYELITLSQDIREAGHAYLAEQLLWERRKTTNDTRLLQQLLSWAQERNDSKAALKLAEQIFQLRSTLEHYRLLREAAESAGQWPYVERKVLASLASTQGAGVLIEIHLEEGRIDDALTLLSAHEKTDRTYSYYPYSVTMRLKVARAAEIERPKAAIEIYLAEAHRLISARGRQNYAEAARHLTRVHGILQGTGESEHWRTLIARIREDNRRLPALKDELNKAGL